MIAKGNISKEAQEYKRYVGICPVSIAAVVPNKEEHEALFNVTLDEAPNYITKTTDNDGNEIPNARIAIILKPDEERALKDMPLISMPLFVQKKVRYNSNKTKVQVIDKFGRTTWATTEEYKAHKIPMSKNGTPLNIDADYRLALVGEEDLMAFVKAYLCIPDIDVYDSNSKKFVKNLNVSPEDCECRFNNLNKIFDGDFSEIKEALGYQPTNKVKVLLGVRKDIENNKLYQTVYTRRFLKSNSTSIKALSKEINDMITNATSSGRVLNTEYELGNVREYKVTPTEFVQNNAPAPEVDNMPDPNQEIPW